MSQPGTPDTPRPDSQSEAGSQAHLDDIVSKLMPMIMDELVQTFSNLTPMIMAELSRTTTNTQHQQPGQPHTDSEDEEHTDSEDEKDPQTPPDEPQTSGSENNNTSTTKKKSVKLEKLLSERLGAKSVRVLPGIDKGYGPLFEKKGYTTARNLVGQYMVSGSPHAFRCWLRKTFGKGSYPTGAYDDIVNPCKAWTDRNA